MNEREQELFPPPSLFPSYVLTYFSGEIRCRLASREQKKTKQKKRSVLGPSTSLIIRYTRNGSSYGPHLIFCRGHITEKPRSSWAKTKLRKRHKYCLSGLCKIADATPPLTDLIVFEPLISDFGIHLEIPRTAFDDDVDCCVAIESEMFASENQFGRILDPTGI